ncbi:MAG: lysozyme [Pseudomonadota bacterium]
MRISQNGVELLKKFEGLETRAYEDIAGIVTIGYGHTGAYPSGFRLKGSVQLGDEITEAEAEELLRADLRPREQAVERLTSVPLNQNEFDALVSFVYNVGENAYRNSTARRRLNKEDRDGAAEALTWWNKATIGGVLRPVKGLTRRRAAEAALFTTPVERLAANPPRASDSARIQPVESAPRRGNIADSRTIQGATVAGGAGVASTTMGRRDAQELDEIETRIEQGDDFMITASGGDASDTDQPAPTDDAADEAPADEEPADEEPAEDTSTEGGDGGNIDGGETAGGAEDADAPDTGGDEDTGDDEDEGELIIIDPEPGADGGDGDIVDLSPDTDDGAGDDGLTEIIEVDDGLSRPAKDERHETDAQIQMALLILIVLSVGFIIISRIDDWLNYRR